MGKASSGIAITGGGCGCLRPLFVCCTPVETESIFFGCQPLLREGRGGIIAVFGTVRPSVVALEATEVAFEETEATDQTDELEDEAEEAIDGAGE